MSDKLDKLIGGRYLVVRSLRQTHLCETFIAQDTQLPGNPLCVVKQLKPQSSEQFIFKTARRLFNNEAKVLYRLGDHPQIPRLLAHLQVGEQFYLVQEFIEGKDLSQEEIVSENQELWTEEKAINFLHDVLDILAFVHGNNVIHRDIKPSNLIRKKDGKIVLIDFGAVKEKITNMTVTEGQPEQDRTVVVGTPGYMAPEQYLGKPRFNSDIYSLGMTLVHGLTGFHPDRLDKDEKTENAIWRDRASQCNSKLADAIDKMIRHSYFKRYQSVNEVVEALERIEKKKVKTKIKKIQTDEEPSRKFTWKTLLGLIGAIFLIGGAIVSPRIWHAISALNSYTEGNNLIKEGKYEDAIAAYDRAIKVQPDFTQAWTNKGFALGKLGKSAEKFASCVQATNVAPDFAEAWNCRGLARFDLKEYKTALEEYDRAIAVDADFYRAWFNKGQVYMKLQQYEEAITATEKVVEIEPEYYLAWTQICRAWFQLQDYQEAKKNCDKSLTINSQHQSTLDLSAKIKAKLQ